MLSSELNEEVGKGMDCSGDELGGERTEKCQKYKPCTHYQRALIGYKSSFGRADKGFLTEDSLNHLQTGQGEGFYLTRLD